MLGVRVLFSAPGRTTLKAAIVVHSMAFSFSFKFRVSLSQFVGRRGAM